MITFTELYWIVTTFAKPAAFHFVIYFDPESIYVCQLVHIHLIAVNYLKQWRLPQIFKYTDFGNFEAFQLTNHLTEDWLNPTKLVGKFICLNMIFNAVDDINRENNWKKETMNGGKIPFNQKSRSFETRANWTEIILDWISKNNVNRSTET